MTQDGGIGAGVTIDVLGPLRVDGPRGPVTVPGVKERTLLAMLTANRGRMVPVPDLVEALWGQAPPPSAQKSLQTFVLRVRKVLEPDRSAPALVITDGGGYRLAVPASAVDAERFADLAASARAAAQAGRPSEALGRFSEGLALWRGPAYVEFAASGFAQAEARRLDEIRQTAVEEWTAVRLDLDGADAVVPDLERLVSEQPYRERLWALLIRGLYRQGRQGEALGAFDRARRLLGDELGVAPGRELQDLHAQVLAQDRRLDAPHPVTTLPVDLVPDGPLLGRGREFDRLLALWARARDGDAVCVVVRGPAAAGGLRLAQELAAVAGTDAEVVSCLQRSAGRLDPLRSPCLVIADPAHASHPSPGQLIVVLAGPEDETPDRAEVLALQMLAFDEARKVVAAHVRSDELNRATEEILATTPAWPVDLDRAATRWAREWATATVRDAAASVTRTTDELARARRQLSDGVLALGGEPAAASSAPNGCPWRGLSAYDVEDAPWFAGRERLVAELLARVAGSRLVALVGPSGSGKSSALRAGLVAALQGGALPGSAGWTYLLFRPGPHPLRELTRHSLQAGFPSVPLGDLLEQLIRGTETDTGRRVILAVDQLEEAWTACQDVEERTTFLDALADLARDPLSAVTVVLTIRPDFLPQLAEHPPIADPLADNTVLVGTPTRAEVIRAVQRPAAAGGLRLQLGLTDTVADDAAGEPGLLPLLSTALTRLWAHRDGPDLTLAGYVAGGGLAGAISGMAEDAFTVLCEDDRLAARVLLLRLAGPGRGSAVTRRRVPLAEIAGLPNPRVLPVVELLATARLLTVTQDSVEVAHEALFTRWPRLRSWLAEDAATRDTQLRLAAAAADWDQQGRDPGLLWQGTRLAAGRVAAQTYPDEFTQIERDFLDTGIARVDAQRRDAEERATVAARQVRRLRWLVGGIVLLLIAATVVGAVAVAAQRRAEAATASAEAATASAEARRLAAQAVTEQHLDLGLLSAVEAVRAEPGPETYGALLALLVRSPRIVTQVHAQGRFLRAAASPDGTTVYLAENGPMWSAFDAATGEEKWTAGLPTSTNELAADPAGRGVLTTLWPDGRLHIVLLDGNNGGQVWSTPAPDGNELGYGAAWLADGRWVVAGTGGVVVGDGDSGRIESETPWPAELSGFLPDFMTTWQDGRVGLADNNRTVVFDPSSGAVTTFAAPGSVRAVSAAGVLVAVDDTDPERPIIRLRDPAGADLSAPIPSPGFAGGVRFSPDGTELAVGEGEVLQLRDGHSGDLRTELHGHSGAVMGIAYAGSDMMWTAGRDGLGIAWDLTAQRGILRSAPSRARTWLGDTDEAGAVAVGLSAPSGAYNTVSVLDPRTGSLTHPALPLPADCRWCESTSVAITPDGRTALAGVVQYPDIGGKPDYSGPDQNRGYLQRWDTATGSTAGTTELPWPPAGLAVTADGRGVVVNGNRASALLDLATGQTRWGPVPHTAMQDRDATRTVSISPDGRSVLVGTGDGVQILDSGTGKVLAHNTFAEPDVVSATAFSADGSTAIAGTYGGYLHVLSATDLQPIAPRRLTTGGWLIGLAVSPDGAYLASLGGDGDLLLWDTSIWQPLGQPISDDNGWGFLGFDPDGRTLRAVHQDGTVLTFLVDPNSWIRQACAVANRDLTADESEIIRPGQPARSTCAGYR